MRGHKSPGLTSLTIKPFSDGYAFYAALEERLNALSQPAVNANVTPTVSVIIPAYNAERTIAATLQSCLRQTVLPLEVLVIDDGSSDRTAEIVASCAGPVRLLRKLNGGPASARNYGAHQAQGTWLAML